MDKKQFYETYCMRCGTQQCEGIDSEWGEGCQWRWNLDGMDPASEIKRLNDKIMELAGKVLEPVQIPIVAGELAKKIEEQLKMKPSEETERGKEILKEMFEGRENKMAKLCPFKKETVTIIEYGFTSVEREKPTQIKKDEHFGVCDGLNCMAYDGGICLLMEGNK